MARRDLRDLRARDDTSLCEVAAAIVGGSVLGAGATMLASSNAADASQAATEQSLALQKAQYDDAQARQGPFQQAGYTALPALMGRLGLPTSSVQSAISAAPGSTPANALTGQPTSTMDVPGVGGVAIPTAANTNALAGSAPIYTDKATPNLGLTAPPKNGADGGSLGVGIANPTGIHLGATGGAPSTGAPGGGGAFGIGLAAVPPSALGGGFLSPTSGPATLPAVPNTAGGAQTPGQAAVPQTATTTQSTMAASTPAAAVSDGSYNPAAFGAPNALTGQPSAAALTGNPQSYGNGGNPTFTDPGFTPPAAYQAPTAPAPFSYTASDYKASPAYQWQLSQALGGVLANASATGALKSGAAMKALSDRAENVALTDFNNERAAAQGIYNTNYAGYQDQRNFGYGQNIDQRNYNTANYDTNRAFAYQNYQNQQNYLTNQANTQTGNLFNLTNIGSNAVGNVNNAGQNYANTATNALTNNAATQANAGIVGANSINSLLGTGVKTLAYSQGAGGGGGFGSAFYGI